MASVQTGVNALVDYAAVLAKHGGKDYLPDLRDLVNEMVWVWAPEDDIITPGEPTRLQQEFHQKINSSVRKALSKAAISSEQAEAVVCGLSIHAEKMADSGNLLSVWQCSRLAKRLREDFVGQTSQPLILRGNFMIDESDRFMKFGSVDQDHVMTGWLWRHPTLVFNNPVLADQVPDGWHEYHLSGRNIRNSDRIWSVIPQQDYTGSVLAPGELVKTKRNMVRLNGQFTMSGEVIPLNEFCEQHGFKREDFDRLFPEQKQIMGGLSFE